MMFHEEFYGGLRMCSSGFIWFYGVYVEFLALACGLDALVLPFIGNKISRVL